jgi:hypothetical protein
VNRIGEDIWSSYGRIEKTSDKMTTKLNIELHMSLNNMLMTKSSTSNKILDVLFLGDREDIRGGENLNPKKIAIKTKISHKKLLTKTSFNKDNILRVIASDERL